MGLIGSYKQLTNGEDNDATEVMYNFNLIKTVVNGGIDSTNFAVTSSGVGLGATAHGNLSSTSSTMHCATSSIVTDSANHFASPKNVETALAALGNFVGMYQGGGVSMGGLTLWGFPSESSTVYGNADTPVHSVAIPANTIRTGILVFIYGGELLMTDTTTSTFYLPIKLTSASTEYSLGLLPPCGNNSGNRFALSVTYGTASYRGAIMSMHAIDNTTLGQLTTPLTLNKTVENTISFDAIVATGATSTLQGLFVCVLAY